MDRKLEGEGAAQLVWMQWRRENSHHCPFRELNPVRPAHNLVIILTELIIKFNSERTDKFICNGMLFEEFYLDNFQFPTTNTGMAAVRTFEMEAVLSLFNDSPDFL